MKSAVRCHDIVVLKVQNGPPAVDTKPLSGSCNVNPRHLPGVASSELRRRMEIGVVGTGKKNIWIYKPHMVHLNVSQCFHCVHFLKYICNQEDFSYRRLPGIRYLSQLGR